MTIRPHGGRLIDRFVREPGAIADLESAALGLPGVRLAARASADVDMIATGALSPLEGFMTRADYDGVVESCRLAIGLPWTIPITLAVPETIAREADRTGRLALRAAGGALLAVLTVADVFRCDRRREAARVYGTTDGAHPGVEYLMGRPEWLVGGPLDVVQRATTDAFEPFRLDPRETRVLFRSRAWRTVVAFQTRNPVHRAHEYIQKCALELVDGLLLHPLVGATKDDDVPADVRLRCYQVLIERHFPRDRVVLSVFPAAMRYAGPREAIFHALVRKNYGCTHIIIGRDHAGVGRYYGSFDAQRIFQEFDAAELGITPLFFDHTFYCRRCEGMASAKTCPHPEGERVVLSGTAVRRLLESGEVPPDQYTRPEVAEILREAYTTRMAPGAAA